MTCFYCYVQWLTRWLYSLAFVHLSKNEAWIATKSNKLQSMFTQPYSSSDVKGAETPTIHNCVWEDILICEDTPDLLQRGETWTTKGIVVSRSCSVQGSNMQWRCSVHIGHLKVFHAMNEPAEES